MPHAGQRGARPRDHHLLGGHGPGADGAEHREPALAVSTMSVIARRLNATKHQFAIAEKHLLFLEKMLMDAQSTTVSATITSAQL